MNINEYAGYFHDGNLIDIRQIQDSVTFYIESFPIDKEEIQDETIKLTKINTLKGILHVDKIKSIKIGNKPFKGTVCKEYDDGEILDLEIFKNKVIFLIEWNNFPPKNRITVSNKIEIEANKIWWENLPDWDQKQKI